LGQNFFGLSSDYRIGLLDEIYYLVRHANFTYADIMVMPTYERKYFINKLSNEFEKRAEAIERSKSKR
jgi:hypothetical protein